MTPDIKKFSWFPWNGSKRWMLPRLATLISRWPGAGTYWEPFVGGGGVSHLVRQLMPTVPQVINDKNPWLASVFQSQLDGELPCLTLPDTLTLEFIISNRDMTDLDLPSLTTSEKAIRFCVCLLTAWGNRWKTEDSGAFTPSSTPVNKKFCGDDYLRRRFSKLISREPWLCSRDVVLASDWSLALADVKPGDLVYLDPPYPESLGYGNQKWTFSDQLDVVDWAAEAVSRGVFVVVSNMCDLARLYVRAGMQVEIIQGPTRSRTRKPRQELLAWNLPACDVESGGSALTRV